MNLRPVHLLIPLLGVALGLVIPFEKPVLPKKKKKGSATVVAPAVGGKWASQRFLDERMEEACAWVKEATGMDFVERPTAKASTPEAVAAFLAPDMGKAFRTLGAQDAEGVKAMARELAGQLVAAYNPTGNVVHILPANAVAAAKAADDESLTHPNVLRLVLVRMGVVALDRQLLTDWKDALDGAKSVDAVHCAGAVLEGHAQYETQRIAKNWANTEDDFDANTFDKLVTLLTAAPAADASQSSKAMAGEAKFAIVKGHAFMAAIAKKRRPGIRGVLAKPPTDRNHIFKPADYLARFTKTGRLPENVLKEFAGLMPEAGGWKVTGEACPAEDVAKWMTPLKKGIWNAEVSAFIKGNKWTAIHAEGGAQSQIYLMQFRTGGMAESYANLAQAAAKDSGAKVEEGAGRDGGLPGFSAQREADGKTDALQLAVEGKYVLAFVTSDSASERDPWDDAMEAAAELVGKAQKTRVNRRDK